MTDRETAITVDDLESDYRPILEWYVHQPASKGNRREAARTVIRHGITGRYQVKVLIDACKLYLAPRDIPEEKRERAEAVLEEMEALYRTMADVEAGDTGEPDPIDLETPDGKVLAQFPEG